jgi:rhodanese-related sulfurtransferase
MTFPFTALSAGAREGGLIVAVLIGIAFGFVLERAGFGRSPKLAAQFYLRDMTVFKVMFSAIVTAMLGLIALSGIGLVNLRDISEQIASWTWIWPMLVGGFVLGVGFIVSGYCPGTSIVASASGNVDGMFAFAGVVTGTFVYSELLQFAPLQRFHLSGEKGAWFLYDLLKISPQVLAALVTMAAIGAFIGAEKVERIVSGHPAADETPSRTRRVAFATLVSIGALTLLTMALPAAPASAAATPASISASDLAHVVVAEPWTVRIVDLRDASAFAKSRIPGSENVRSETLPDLAQQTAGSGRRLIVVSGSAAAPLPQIGDSGAVRLLQGGFAAWQAFALEPAAPPPAGASRPVVDEYLFRVSLNQMLTGQKQAPAATPLPAAGAVAAPKKKGGGCSS